MALKTTYNLLKDANVITLQCKYCAANLANGLLDSAICVFFSVTKSIITKILLCNITTYKWRKNIYKLTKTESFFHYSRQTQTLSVSENSILVDKSFSECNAN